jgi:hypothetical protein
MVAGSAAMAVVATMALRPNTNVAVRMKFSICCTRINQIKKEKSIYKPFGANQPVLAHIPDLGA